MGLAEVSNDLYTKEFEAAWQAYPRRVGKLPAAKAWAKLSESDQAVCIVDIEKRVRARWFSADPKKIAHFATYLNQQRYFDEWQDDLKYRSEAEPEFAPRPTYQHDPGVERDKWGHLAQRITFKWLMSAGGVAQERISELVKIKNDTVNELRQAMSEEADQYEAAYTLCDTVLLRLDLAFDRSLRAGVMASAKKKA